jgi:hypothetical protein
MTAKDSAGCVSAGVPVIITQPTAYTVSGSVELQGFVGSSRMVRFVFSEVSGATTNYLQTNDVTLSFTGGVASYSLQVPINTTHVSAKTQWSLRRRQAVTFVSGSATVNFTAATSHNLLGGDLATAVNGTIDNTDNQVLAGDYLVLKGKYLHTVGTDSDAARADITGDGSVLAGDYLILKGNYLKQGDPQ